jgi:hypothetical protein
VAGVPEGAQGSQKLFRDRYRLQRFGRGGYVKLALKLSAPILPTAIIGGEEVNPLLGRLSLFRRGEGADYLPITPPSLARAAGPLAAPVKWRVIVGEPVDLSAYGPDAADDALLVHRLNEQIRSILQALVDQARARGAPCCSGELGQSVCAKHDVSAANLAEGWDPLGFAQRAGEGALPSRCERAALTVLDFDRFFWPRTNDRPPPCTGPSPTRSWR